MNVPLPPKPQPAAAGSARGKLRRTESAQHTLLFGLAKHRRALLPLLGGVAAVVAVVALVVHFTDLRLETVTTWIDGISPLALLPLMALLPLVGFPIVVVHLVIGARYGLAWGGVVVAATTAVHLLGTYVIARSMLRKPLQRFIEKRHARLPEIPVDEQAAICVIAMLVPGLPYLARNYLLALAGVKLRYLMAICLPIHVARSYVTLLLGDLSTDPGKTKGLILLGVNGVMVAICAFVIWRLRLHHRRFHGSPEQASAPSG